MRRRTAALALVTIQVMFAQEIHLKTRNIRADASSLATPTGVREAAVSGRHQIVQFDHTPSIEDLDALLTDGNTVVGVLPDNAVVVASATGQVLSRDGITYIGVVDAGDKLSPELNIDGLNTSIVEFHQDVTIDAQNDVATAEGMSFQRPAVLALNHAIVTGSLDDLKGLAAHDEVAYIFPADPELLTDPAFNPCAGMLTSSGIIPQYANLVHGWDLDADHAAHLGYAFGSITPKAPAATVRSEIIRALNEWAKNTNIIFQPAAATAPRTILVKFASGAHGDNYPFDGQGGILAHTFYPVPVNPESIAGDMHLDADENWHVGSDTDIYSVALHEAGHAIGLGHSDKPGDVMYPYYRPHMSLSVNDIGAAQALYGLLNSAAPVTSAPVTSAPPSGGTQTGGTQTPPAAAALRLTLDPVQTSAQVNQISITGTLSGGLAPFSVQWQTDHGYSGSVLLAGTGPSGATSLSASAITLVNGSNTVTVTAFDSARKVVTQTASVMLVPAPNPVSSTPILLTVSSPAASVVSVNSATLSVAGTASGGAGIARVTWQTTGGATGTASGTTHWLASAIPLLTGTNTIVVRAFDTLGANVWSALVAVRH
jgi:hypothetical protein